MRKQNILSILIIISLGLVVYANALHGSFQFDDHKFIVNNPSIRELTNIGEMWRFLGHPSRFIAFFSFALNYHVHQLDVFGYHLVNVMIHVVNGILVWWFILLIFASPRMGGEEMTRHRAAVALTAACLFVSHPVQTQAVSYISQRFASMATMFYLLAVCLYMSARLDGKRSFLKWAGSLAAAFLGMFTKQIVWTLPFAILMVEHYFFHNELMKKVRWKFLLALLLLTAIIPLIFLNDFSAVFSHGFNSRSHYGEDLTAGNYLLTQFRVILTYIRLLTAPLGQNLDYDFKLSPGLLDPATSMSFMFLFGLLAASVLVYKKHVLLSFGIVWFFLTQLVESSVIPIPHVIFEHRMYLPSVGFCLALSALIWNRPRKRGTVSIACIILILTLSYLTVERNKVWQSEVTLWSDVVHKSPRKARSHYNLGAAYLRKGDLERALTSLNRSLELNARSQSAANTFHNRGLVFEQQGRFRSAFADYSKAIELNPRLAVAYNNRGTIYKHIRQYELALADYDQALSINPSKADVYVNRGVVLKLTGDMDGALKDYNTAIKLDPGSEEAYNNRGVLYLDQKRFKDAMDDFNRASGLNPKYAEAYNNRAIAHREQGRLDLALEDYDRAISLNPNYFNAYNNRANLHQDKGDLQAALDDYNKAIDLQPFSAVTYYNRALVRSAQRNYQAALDDALKAKSLGFERAGGLIAVFSDRARKD